MLKRLKDPYGAGWLIKIRIEDESEVDDLFSNDDYVSLEGVSLICNLLAKPSGFQGE